MTDPRKPCELCRLPVGTKPFTLKVQGKTLDFCCEGCKKIYELLHEIKDSSENPQQH